MSETRTDTANQIAASVYDVRRDPKIKQMLLDLEKQITATVSNISGGLGEFTAAQLVQALSDRELLTLELWATEQDMVIRDECKCRQDEYEDFARHLASRGEFQPYKP
jgi:hypothetical protein